MVSALFTAYAIEGVAPVQWGRKLVDEILPRAYKYLEKQERDWEDYKQDLHYFEAAVRFRFLLFLYLLCELTRRFKWSNFDCNSGKTILDYEK